MRYKHLFILALLIGFGCSSRQSLRQADASLRDRQSQEKLLQVAYTAAQQEQSTVYLYQNKVLSKEDFHRRYEENPHKKIAVINDTLQIRALGIEKAKHLICLE